MKRIKINVGALASKDQYMCILFLIVDGDVYPFVSHTVELSMVSRWGCLSFYVDLYNLGL